MPPSPPPCARVQVLKQLAASEKLRPQVLKAGGGKMVQDLLQSGDEYCRSHAAEAVCSLALDQGAQEVLLELNVVQLLLDLVRGGGAPRS